ncbi:hypothetical protein [Sphingomonas immobilis]|uniref:Uncharacterized protein n=1 Tax=Sphingomonas immobilis TaxID=3063997 RepID=A0ABT8ZY40_9SPHN|nr:hypothetical protein [Sphingomonas sp. CA1-15]MDO7842488.1 hypothetical protein [Sphingomonas sp. CA1-15]
MIDNLALAITHGLMALAVWVLLKRVDLNHEPSPHDRDAKGRRRGDPDFEEKDAHRA